MREDGYVEIVGRIKDMIIRGGENIYPREVEEFLYAHPKIADVQVVGVPHERYGEEVLACVVVRDAADPLTLEELRAYCAGQLAHYKVPSRLQLLDSFPMTVSGKVRKVELRAPDGKGHRLFRTQLDPSLSAPVSAAAKRTLNSHPGSE